MSEHIENMKNELFMLKYGYWFKTKDVLENLDRDYELTKFKYVEKKHPKHFNYISKSEYPKIILKQRNEPPYLCKNPHYPHPVCQTDNNNIEYTFMDYQPHKQIGDVYHVLKESRRTVGIETYKEELNIKIKSLESMIFLLERHVKSSHGINVVC